MELVYVTNEDSGELSIISSQNNEVVSTIYIGKRPRGVRVSRDGRTVYVALNGSPKCPPWMSQKDCDEQITDKPLDGIAVIDVLSQQVTDILPGGSDPEQFDISLDGNQLYVANEDAHIASNDVSVIDANTLDIILKIPVGENPWGIAIGPAS